MTSQFKTFPRRSAVSRIALRAYINRATSYLAKGRTTEAMADLNDALRLDPKDAKAYSTRSTLNLTKGDLSSAVADANEAIRLDAQCAEAFCSRSGAYHFQGNLDRALADASEVIRLAPDRVTGYVQRGGIYRTKGDPSKAFSDATRNRTRSEMCGRIRHPGVGLWSYGKARRRNPRPCAGRRTRSKIGCGVAPPGGHP